MVPTVVHHTLNPSVRMESNPQMPSLCSISFRARSQGTFCASMKAQITSLTVASSGNPTGGDRSLSVSISAYAGLSRISRHWLVPCLDNTRRYTLVGKPETPSYHPFIGTFYETTIPTGLASLTEEAEIVSSANDALFRSIGLSRSVSPGPVMRTTQLPAETIPNSPPAYPQSYGAFIMIEHSGSSRHLQKHDRAIIKIPVVKRYSKSLATRLSRAG
ncbi:hypothetical protein B0H65DRAFT_315248 [Neurospora tetraspora]|uniref:Uncharacterized protein n=1 Tax=Neurospora tetraspora TaxID=94610 RepID=A0AAE0J7A2_9PEZI|nr:hypothetical protein B0H65DRAFT_315248 [Neurospora tetraspora]